MWATWLSSWPESKRLKHERLCMKIIKFSMDGLELFYMLRICECV
jgi:hypothetical protein